MSAPDLCLAFKGPLHATFNWDDPAETADDELGLSPIMATVEQWTRLVFGVKRWRLTGTIRTASGFYVDGVTWDSFEIRETAIDCVLGVLFTGDGPEDTRLVETELEFMTHGPGTGNLYAAGNFEVPFNGLNFVSFSDEGLAPELDIGTPWGDALVKCPVTIGVGVDRELEDTEWYLGMFANPSTPDFVISAFGEEINVGYHSLKMSGETYQIDGPYSNEVPNLRLEAIEYWPCDGKWDSSTGGPTTPP